MYWFYALLFCFYLLTTSPPEITHQSKTLYERSRSVFDLVVEYDFFFFLYLLCRFFVNNGDNTLEKGLKKIVFTR